MTCVVDFDGAVPCRAPADDGDVISGEDLFADGAIDMGDDEVEGDAHGEEVAKERVNLGHEQGGGDAFSGDVTEEEVELAVVLDEVAVVAADGSERSVVVVGVPAAGAQLGWRQKFGLELSGEVQVSLQCVALGFIQVVEAVADEWICEQAVLLDGVVALFAEAVGSNRHSVEGGVDFAE